MHLEAGERVLVHSIESALECNVSAQTSALNKECRKVRERVGALREHALGA